MANVKGVLSCDGKVRLTEQLRAEMQSMAAEQGRALPEIKTAEDLFEASLATMSQADLQLIIDIQNKVLRRHGLAHLMVSPLSDDA